MAKLRGFTLLEILTVLGIFLGISFLVIPYTIQALQTNRARSTANDIASIMFRLQQDAYSSRDLSNYGISFASDAYTTFVGDSLASASSSEEYPVLRGVSITNLQLGGGSEVFFTQGELVPSHTGSLAITDGVDTFQIIINPEGLIYVTKL